MSTTTVPRPISVYCYTKKFKDLGKGAKFLKVGNGDALKTVSLYIKAEDDNNSLGIKLTNGSIEEIHPMTECIEVYG